ncbi:carbohydrate ABC transporter permease [Robinsoniella peoriensis]|uniref:carbohydrate ABC transporter permease n=1 Tax=Robinsoniella peoriensis TaxID=180332 RepID=UPI00085C06E5|nr:carbohydrate ABC transporter permease [Robinsoniella peoriensis]
MNKKKTSFNNTMFNVITYAFFAIFTLICIYPFYFLLINSISANDLSARGQIFLLPQGIHFSNYVQILQLPGLLRAAGVSLFRTAVGTFGTVLGSAYLGFMFTQQHMWKRKFWYRFTVVTMYFNAGIIPWFLTMNNLGFTNNIWAYVIPAIVQPFNIILVKTYIESTPVELQEAASIDGASILKIFYKIILPISKPILATVSIFAAVGQWNSFQDTLILMTEEKYYTLQYVLYKYINQANSLAASIKSNSGITGSQIADLIKTQTPTSVQMTVAIIVVLPILLVYPFFQRYFVKGVMIGSVKG